MYFWSIFLATWGRWGLVSLVLMAALLPGTSQAQPGAAMAQRRHIEPALTPKVLWRSDVVLPGGVDHGQRLGTVLEVRAGSGQPVLAAGFVSGGQTGGLNNHRALSVYAATPPDAAAGRGRSDGGVNAAPQVFAERPFGPSNLFLLTTFRGQLLARLRSGTAPVKRWSIAAQRWEDLGTAISRMAELDPAVSLQVVGNELLGVFPKAVIYADEQLDVSAAGDFRELSLEAALYFNGKLHLNAVRGESSSGREAFLIECRWLPGMPDLRDCERIRLHARVAPGVIEPSYTVLGMHPLADGQILVYGLNGYLYLYRQGQLRPLVDVSANRAWQVYSSTERYGRILLGHYPSGNLVSLSLAEHLSDRDANAEWTDSVRDSVVMEPPIQAPGLVKRDEAQSMMLLGDRMLVGMWPWGEVFEGRPGGAWHTAIPSLTGREPTEDGLHPYEAETGNNCLGMRIFQILPWRGGAVFQTTIKNEDAECRKTLAQADAATLEDYGRVHYLDVPGHMSCHLPWSVSPTRLSFTVTDDDRLQVSAGGQTLCSRGVDAKRLVSTLNRPEIRSWKMPAVGLYGRRTQVSPDRLR